MLILKLGYSLIVFKMSAISLAVWYLLIGSFSMDFRITWFIFSGISEIISLGGITGSWICIIAIEIELSAL